MSVASRLLLVSSLFALTTQYVAVVRYPGGCAWKKFHAFLLERSFRSNSAPSFACPRCSYE